MNDATRPADTNSVAERPKLLPVVDDGEFAALLDSNRFAQIQRVAALFSESDLIPEVFQGKPANCAVALQMAFRMRVDPMMLMQNMYIVHGKPGIEAKLAIALINTRGPFTGPLQWKFEGEAKSRSCTCYATHRSTGEQCRATVTWKMVEGEGWNKNSKWTSMQDQMFMYRSATFLGRLYCPEVLLGLPTNDELHDVGPRLVEGERLGAGGDVISLPRARSAPAQQTEQVIDAGQNIAETNGTAGEAEPDGNEAETKSAAGEAATLDLEPKAKPAATSAQVDMTKKASDAQKRMIIDIAKRQGLTVAQLDEHLIERFTMGIDELPLGIVNETIQFVRGLKPAAA